MLAFQGPAQPSLALGDALNAGYRYLEVKYLGYDTHQTVALDVVHRPKWTPIHELERGANSALNQTAIRSSAAILWRCERTRSPP
jgi:hypothetical protein